VTDELAKISLEVASTSFDEVRVESASILLLWQRWESNAR
jgi:hypothetical protein